MKESLILKMNNNILDLTNRIAIITGAGGHLGRVFSQALSKHGAQLILIDKFDLNIEDFDFKSKGNSGVNHIFIKCDLESHSDRENLIKKINEDFHSIDILVNNAAFTGNSSLVGWATDFINQSIQTWNRAFEVNLTANFHLTQGISEKLNNGKNPAIINIASIYGFLGPDWSLYENTDMSNPAAYGSSKAGLIQLTKWLATTLGPKIRVNSISPGGIFRNQPDSFVKKYENATPLRRLASEEDMVGALLFLASDMSLYVTGINLVVDGGKSAL